MSIKVSISRHTAGLKNAEDVSLSIGDKVVYKLNNGCLIEAVIKTEELLANGFAGKDEGKLSYDGLCLDNNRMEGLIKDRIVWWEGKPEPKPNIHLKK